MALTTVGPTSVEDMLSGGGLHSVFQPIVDIETLHPVGYEALSRGPSPDFEAPKTFIAAAYEAGIEAEMDWSCRLSAYQAALDAGMGSNTTLFVNVEPATLGSPAPAHVAEAQGRALQRLRVVLEVSEGALTSRPAQVLAAAQWARGHGWGVALDNLGADASVLALLPLLRPDVVKLDLQLLEDQPEREVAAMMTAVSAYTEQSGASILAEGIETLAQLSTARALGARYGQGYLLGRPGSLPAAGPGVGRAVQLVPAQLPVPGHTPFEVVAACRPLRLATKTLVTEMAAHLEAEASGLATPPVVLSARQQGELFTSSTAQRYGALAERSPLVVALGVGIEEEPLPGVMGRALAADERLAREWSVLVIGAHYACALVSREVESDKPGQPPRYDYALTHDRALVLDAAATLVRRLAPPA